MKYTKTEIVKVIRTSVACPAQWEGKDLEGNNYSFSYRYGWLTAKQIKSNIHIIIFEKQLSHSVDGVMSYGELLIHTHNLFEMPEWEEIKK